MIDPDCEYSYATQPRKSSRGLVGLFLILGAATGIYFLLWR